MLEFKTILVYNFHYYMLNVYNSFLILKRLNQN